MPVIEVSAGDQYLVVSGDTPLLDVYSALPTGLYPPFPPVELPGGVGGLVARGGFGQNFFFASEVLGVRFRARSGRLVQAGGRVVKNVQGYDLVRPFVGSFGLLGEVQDVTLRLRPGVSVAHQSRPGTLDDLMSGVPGEQAGPSSRNGAGVETDTEAWDEAGERGVRPQPPRARFLWQDGAGLHALHFGHARDVQAVMAAFGGAPVEEVLDYTGRFPDGIGVGGGEALLRDLRFGWANGTTRPEVPALFERVAAAL
jgi:glycolate oxidase FAD binding subunit